MEPPIDHSPFPNCQDQLTKLKRVTKIDQWNILCRWAFCRSLAEPTIPHLCQFQLTATWRCLGAFWRISDILLIALKQRCHNDNLGTEHETLAIQFRLHLHRGIAYLLAIQILKNRDLIAIQSRGRV